jgi:hypothetical protein
MSSSRNGTLLLVDWCGAVMVHMFSGVMLSNWAGSSWHFEGSQGLHVQGQAAQEIWSFEISRTACPMTERHIPEDLKLQQHCCEDLKY